MNPNAILRTEQLIFKEHISLYKKHTENNRK